MELPLGYYIERIYCADLAPGQRVRIIALLHYNARGTVVYVGATLIEVAIGDAVCSFLPSEVETL